MEQKYIKISSIGEFGLIDNIRKIVDIRVEDTALHDNLLIGIADDAAVFRTTVGKVQLFTTDAFVEGIHFDLTFTSFKHLGWKVITANISDIAAMGGVPRYVTIALSLPQKITVEMVEEFYEGAALACKKYSCLIVGGDTTASLTNMVISVALTGEASEQCVRYRKDAKPGEYICVTGHLGASFAGLKILKREKDRYTQSTIRNKFKPNLEPYIEAVERHLMPRPRLDLSKILSEQVKIGAMIDISDGLASEVHHICKESNVGALVYEHNIPLQNITQRIAAEFSEPPTDYALYGGEEYELLFTIGAEEFKKLEMLSSDITIIGRITEKEKGIELVHENGEQEALRFGGWDHFSAS